MFVCVEKKPKWNQATIAELFAYEIEFFISHQKINYGFWTLQMETEKNGKWKNNTFKNDSFNLKLSANNKFD